MTIIKIKTLDQFIKEVQKICLPNNVTNYHKILFRGEADVSWKQEASLFRGKFETETYTKDVNVSLEKDLIDAAKTECPQAFNSCPNAISRLVRMQHYGLPTRLYDVTANPLVALYFSCNIEPEKDGKVMFTKTQTRSIDDVNIMAGLVENIESYEDLLTVEKLYFYGKTNGIFLMDEKFSDSVKLWLFQNVTKPFLFQPPFDNERIKRQQGAMIFSPLLKISPFENERKYRRLEKRTTFDEQMKNFTFKKENVDLRSLFEKKEFVIKAEDKKTILRGLDLIGINEAYVYPELEHQLKTIKYQNIPKADYRFVL